MIIKSNGARVAFDVERVRASVRRAGASSADVEAVVDEVRKTMTAGMTTKDVYAAVQRALTRRAPSVACRYGLRDALLKLGPEGFYFEQYLAALLAHQGYRTELPDEYQGSCVQHEVDVVAEKDGRQYAIEAKFRNTTKDTVHLKDVMASYARYLDLLDGAALQLCPRFAQFWIVTNSTFSPRAATFGRCKGMPLIGWHHPTRETGLASMIDRSGRYPVTVLAISRAELDSFAKAQMLLCDDLTRHEPVDIAHRVGITQSRAEELIERAEGVIGDASR